jgi:hypothetical protein
MAAQARRKVTKAKSLASTPTEPAKAFLAALPPDLPDVYGMQVNGECLAPSIPHGAVAVVSETEPARAGDFVCLWFRPEFVQTGHHQTIIKRLVMAAPPWVKSYPHNEHPDSDVKAIVILERLNPRQQFHVSCDQLLAIHKVTGVQKAKA